MNEMVKLTKQQKQIVEATEPRIVVVASAAADAEALRLSIIP